MIPDFNSICKSISAIILAAYDNQTNHQEFQTSGSP
jgi:hypothetical protein